MPINHEYPANAVIKLVFKNIQVSDATNNTFLEQIIVGEQLFFKENVTLDFGSRDYGLATVRHKNGLLRIDCIGEVDVEIIGSIPTKCIYISTDGACNFTETAECVPELKLHINAKKNLFDCHINDAEFIEITYGNANDSSTTIEKSIITKNLILASKRLHLYGYLKAHKALMSCALSATSKGRLTITESNSLLRKEDSNINYYRDSFDTLVLQSLLMLNKLMHSELNFKGATNLQLKLILNNTKLTCDSSVSFAKNSKSHFSFVEFFAISLAVASEAKISGDSVVFKLTKIAQIDGIITIDNSHMSASDINVSHDAVLDGKSKLSVVYQERCLVAGKVTSANTTLNGQYVIALFGGIIEGENVLYMQGVMSATLFGGCIIGSKVFNRTALNINLFGVVSGWYSTIDSLTSLEFGNLYIPYVKNLLASRQELYDSVCCNLRRMTSSNHLDFYNFLADSVPKTTDQLWQTVASRAGIIRTVLSTASIQSASIFTFSYQAVSLVMQMVRMHNLYEWSSFKSFKSYNEVILLLLDLKGLVISGQALKANANNTLAQLARPATKGRETFSKAANDLISAVLPASQVDTAIDISASIVVINVDSRQNGISVHPCGLNLARNQFEQTMTDQYDGVTRHGKNLIFSAGGTRHQLSHAEASAQHLDLSANDHVAAGRTTATEKMNFKFGTSKIEEGASFESTNETFGTAGTFIVDGKSTTNGGNVEISQLLKIGKTGDVNFKKLHLKADTIVDEGTISGNTSKITYRNTDVMPNAKWSMTDSLGNGEKTTWHAGSKIKIERSVLSSTVLEENGASVETDTALLQGDMLSRKGNWNGKDKLVFEFKDVRTTTESNLEADLVATYADTADLKGSESAKSIVVDVKDMPAEELQDYVAKRHKHANKHADEMLSVRTDTKEDTVLESFDRRPGVGLSVATNGNITVNEQFRGRYLNLYSNEGEVNLRSDISAESDVNIFARTNIFKPGVIVESLTGHIQLLAEKGILDNDRGGQIIAHQGNTTAIGAKFTNCTNGAKRTSLVYGDHVTAQSTQESFDVLRGMLKARTVLEIYSAADFNLQPEIISEWLSQHAMGNVYCGSVLHGGTGTEENGGIGLILRVEGSFNGLASTISSQGKNLIFVNKDMSGETKVTVYKSEDRKETHGAARNKHYYTSESAKLFRMEILSEDKNIIHSLEGRIIDLGMQTYAPNGSEVVSEEEMIARPVSYTLHSTHNANRHVHESRKPSDSGQEANTIYAHNMGTTSFTSNNKYIYQKGVIYYGDPGSGFVFDAPQEVILIASVLNNRVQSTSMSAQFAVLGQTLFGSDHQINSMNTLYSLDPTGGAMGNFTDSSNMPEALINGMSAIYGISSMMQSIATDGLLATLSKQLSATLSIGVTKTTFNYQTEGASGFYEGVSIYIYTHGVATFVTNAYGTIPVFEVRADELRLSNTTLYSDYKSETFSVALSVRLDGSYDVGVSYSQSTSHNATQVQRYLDIGEFSVDVRRLHNRGNSIKCNRMVGRADEIENENSYNTSDATQMEVNASLQGSGGASHVQSSNETIGARASILVKEGINDSPERPLSVQHVINHGASKVYTLDPQTNHLLKQGTLETTIEEKLKSKQIGGGFSNKFYGEGKNAMPKVFVNYTVLVEQVTPNGVKKVRESKFKVTVLIPAKPKNEQQYINLGAANNSPASSGKRSLVGDVLNQQENMDYLAYPGYKNGMPSTAIADSQVKPTANKQRAQSYVQLEDFGVNPSEHLPYWLQPAQYPNSPMLGNGRSSSQFSPASNSIWDRNTILTGEVLNQRHYTDASELVHDLLAAQPKKGSLEETPVNSALIGAGRAIVQTGQGAIQFAMQVGEKVGLVDGATLDAYNDRILREHDLYRSTPVANSLSGNFGEVAGEMLLFSVIPGGAAASGGKLALWGATSGAVVTGLQPVYEGDLRQRGINTLLGAASGAVLTPAVAKAFDVGGKAIVTLYAHNVVNNSLARQQQGLTRGQIVEFLQSVDTMPLEQLTSSLREINFKLLHIEPEQQIYKFCHVRKPLRVYDPKNTNPNLYKVDAKANLKSSKFMIEIHFDATSGPHMHITDTHGNVYDKSLTNLTAKLRRENPGWHAKKLQDKVEQLPEAHINIREFVELNMRPENV